MSSLQWAPLARRKHLRHRCSQLTTLTQAILHKLGKVLALLLKSLLTCRKAERRNWPPKSKASSLVRCCDEQTSYEASPIPSSLLIEKHPLRGILNSKVREKSHLHFISYIKGNRTQKTSLKLNVRGEGTCCGCGTIK